MAVMFLLAAVGMVLKRKKFLTDQGTTELGVILLKVIIPCAIVRSFIMEFSWERLMELVCAIALSLTGFVLAMMVSWLIFGKRRPIENFAAAFCNAGFMGLPLAKALIGNEGVFYIAPSIAFLNLFQWTYGLYILTQRKDMISLKRIVKNPVLIAIEIGLLLFVMPLQVPDVILNTLGYIADMNTPVAMLLLGTYMAEMSVKKMLDKRAFGCILIRLLVIPALFLLVLMLLPAYSGNVTTAVYLAAITPVGANICVFAQQYHGDYELSVVTVCLSALLSIITIPVMIHFAQMLL